MDRNPPQGSFRQGPSSTTTGGSHYVHSSPSLASIKEVPIAHATKFHDACAPDLPPSSKHNSRDGLNPTDPIEI